jgi:parallel beta-helix repeat protein
LLQTTILSGQSFNLQEIINKAKDGETIILKEGIYEAEAVPFTDELCGNCLEHKTEVQGTRGFLVSGKSLNITGENKEKVIIKTNAGYGLLFNFSFNSSIKNVTIEGGIRDTSGNATNASIVLKYSRVLIENCILSNDTVRTNKTPVVGISGVVVREGSEAVIRNNLIKNNTWDGIALYKGGTALITDNIIENGRGAGIGITWDASAIILRNRVSGFWKGIGTFGTSNAVVKNNCIFDNLGWGIVISGNSSMTVENNVITRNGNCGIAPWADSGETPSGVIRNNIISDNGWRKEWVCPQVGLWMNADSSRFIFAYNNVWNNTVSDYKDIENLTFKSGNVSVVPDFRGQYDFHLKENSILFNAGDPKITNTDGTRSHIGVDGGQNTGF